MSEEPPSYVSNGTWLRQISRIDTIDEIADQFERPSPSELEATGGEAFWADQTARRRRTVGGWHSSGLVHGRPASERTAS